MKKILKFTILFAVMMSMFIMPASAAEDGAKKEGWIYVPEVAISEVADNGISPRSLITSRQYVDSEDGLVAVRADVVINDGTNQIIDIKNCVAHGWKTGVTNFIVGKPQIMNKGAYGVVTGSYTYQSKKYVATFYFYP